LDPVGGPARRLVSWPQSGRRGAGSDRPGHGRVVRAHAGPVGADRAGHLRQHLRGAEVPRGRVVRHPPRLRDRRLGRPPAALVRGRARRHRAVPGARHPAARPVPGARRRGFRPQPGRRVHPTLGPGPDAGPARPGERIAGGRRSAVPGDRRICRVDGPGRAFGPGTALADPEPARAPRAVPADGRRPPTRRRNEERRRDAAAGGDHRVRARGAGGVPMTAYPNAEDYVRAVQHPDRVFALPVLRRVVFELHPLFGIPMPASGNAAVAFKADLDGTDTALRFFIREDASSRERYAALGQHFAARDLEDCVAHPTWVDDAIRVNGRTWPMVQMSWVDGRTLDAYVGHLAGTANVGALALLARTWREFVARLQAAEFAHGDLQHGNVLIDTASTLRLVDFDGSWIAAFHGGPPPPQTRHPNYPRTGRQR